MLIALLGLLAAVGASPSSLPPPPPCERAPAHAQSSDTHYRLGVAGEPDLFLPGELYTVSLQGVDSGQGPTPFIGFTIWAEISASSNSGEAVNQSEEDSKQSLGLFQAYDAQAKLQEYCVATVDNATAHPKTEIQVIWSAPSTVKDVCIRLCARAGPAPPAAAKAGSWSVLVKELCAAPTVPSNFAKQPPIVEPCCACDEAKYEVTFESLWSRNTHPRDFPAESARAHFSDVIGASHTARFRVWQQGRAASAGLRRLADDGATTALEKELKAESDHIRTIIKARGISWQQVAGAGIPNTFAVFRVDDKHHLVSLAAKLAPSPDWIVGVSALELCNANCTWTRSATLPLYPYDAGTDNGLSYMSRRSPTVPPAPVRALRPDWPRDVRSPFFSSSGEMRPFARLKLTRLRLYERSCDAAGGSDHAQDTGGGGVPGALSSGGVCATHAWGPWSACSVSCGVGQASRQRQYVWPSKAYAEACRVPLTDYRTCHGPRMHCRAPSEYEADPAESSGPCAVSAWSEWSPCEGCGVRARTRHYLAPRAYKRCHVGFRASTVMSQAMPCEIGPCEKPPSALANASSFDWFYADNPRGECRVTSWGGWSPCSARCGRGRRLRTRMYTVSARHQPAATAAAMQAEISRRLLANWNRRFAQLQLIEYPVENITITEPALESQVQEHLDRCQFTLTLQEALCDGEEGTCPNASVAQEVCKLPMSVGHCRGYEERWFYEWARGACEPFGFTGCGGNGNNFRTRDHCLRACRTIVNNTAPKETVSNATVPKKLKPTPPSEDNEVIQNDGPPTEVDDLGTCPTSQWLGWSECSGDCNYAVKLNYRIVLNHATNSKSHCRRFIKSRRCTPAQCREGSDNTTVHSDQSFYENE